MTFVNPFFSIAGQIERIENVGAVLAQSLNPFSSAKPVANVSNPTLKAGLELVAAHPIATAAIAATPIAIATNPTGAAAVGSSILSGGKALVPKSTLGKVVAAPVALFGAAAVTKAAINNPISTTKTILDVPTKIVSAGGDFSDTFLSPKSNPLTIESGIQYLKDHPVASAGAALAVLTTLGYSGATLIAIIQNWQNTNAVKENTNATLAAAQPVPIITQPQDNNTKDTPVTSPLPNYVSPPEIKPSPEVQKSTVEAPSVPKTTTKKKKKKKKTTTKKKKKKKKATRKTSKKKKKKSINKRNK